MPRQQPKSPEFSEIREAIRRQISAFIERNGDDKADTEEIEPIARFLECLPLATSEFDLARARLRNAYRYIRSNEIGAASYELRLLRGQLSEWNA